MASNFDFLKKIDSELYEIILDSERLLRDEYYNQCIINTRIYAETIAKKIYGKNYFQNGIKMTFDDILNSLKDNIKDARDKELIDDMFFIKQEGNKCAHGEEGSGNIAFEVIKRAFEVGINYCNKINHNVDNLNFNQELLITQRTPKENQSPIIQKYVELATLNKEKQELLNKKETEFLKKEKEERQFDKEVGNFEDLNKFKQKTKKKKELTPSQKRVKSRIKEAKKELKNTINKNQKKAGSKQKQKTSSKKTPNKNNKLIKVIAFYIFTIITLYILYKLFL